VIESKSSERDARMCSRNLLERDCAEKPVSGFPIPLSWAISSEAEPVRVSISMFRWIDIISISMFRGIDIISISMFRGIDIISISMFRWIDIDAKSRQNKTEERFPIRPERELP
jgi:hypothetical protein